MCGITGIVAPGEPSASLEVWLNAMLDSIKHRGPDDSGKHVEDGVAFGMRRLSIIDLEGGHQPIYSNDGRYAIVFNGEIYNFIELRETLKAKGHVFRTRSDTEVILRGYMELGENVVRSLNGMFAFAIYDGKKGRIFLARDHFGVKPLYYVERNGMFAFCSEPKPLMDLPGMSRTLDLDALSTFFAYKYVPSPQSFLKEIRKFQPATSVSVDVKTMEASWRSYWQLTTKPVEAGYDIIQKRLGKFLCKAVQRQLISDVPVGVFLSGGIDSGLILWASRHYRSSRESTAYTIGFDDPSFDESELARLTAHFIGAKHEIEYLPMPQPDDLDSMVERFGEPFANLSIPPNFLLSQAAAKYVKVALNGSGGDELFGGYDRYYAVRPPAVLQLIRPLGPFVSPIVNALPVKTKKRSLMNLARRFFELDFDSPATRHAFSVRLFFPEEIGKLFPEAPEIEDPVIGRFAEALGKDDLQRAIWTDITTMLADDYLALLDRTSMAASLEVRVPFLDLEFASFSFSLLSTWKIRNWEKKYILRRFAYDKLPKKIIRGSKKGFESPVGLWFQGPLGKVLTEKMNESPLKKLLNTEFVEQILQDHRKKKRDASKQLLGLYTLVQWIDAFNVTIS